MECFRFEDVSFAYPNESKKILDGVSFSVDRGEFILVCGATGCGKTTMLKLLKPSVTINGEKSGKIYFGGQDIDTLPEKQAACDIGFVMQNPDHQIVTDKVWHELAFGLESLGTDQNEMARRIAEMCGYFGIEDWYYKETNELSGGQKQLLNLASVMVMQPKLLILDEPCSMLDPIAASNFIATVKRLNEETGLTVIMVEHRLEDVLPVCDRVLILDDKKILAFDTPEKALGLIKDREDIMAGMPAAVRLYDLLENSGNVPLTVKQGRAYITSNYKNDIREIKDEEKTETGEKALEFKNVYFRYSKNAPDVTSELSFSVNRGEICCVLGGNGSGKSTLMGIAAGLLRPYSGNVYVFGKKIKDYKGNSLYTNCVSMLPQDVQTVFAKETVRDELASCDLENMPFDIEYLFDRHPYDLSGGEAQKAAMAKVLSSRPKLLLLDEPTKGLDADSRAQLTKILRELKKQGMSVLIVTHDVEFARNADRIALCFKGNIVSSDTPRRFLSSNSFYTTSAFRMTRGFFDNAVSVEDAAYLCRANGRL